MNDRNEIGYKEIGETNDLPVDHLIKPLPSSHEFRFGIKAILLLMTLVALLVGIVSGLARL